VQHQFQSAWKYHLCLDYREAFKPATLFNSENQRVISLPGLFLRNRSSHQICDAVRTFFDNISPIQMPIRIKGNEVFYL